MLLRYWEIYFATKLISIPRIYCLELRSKNVNLVTFFQNFGTLYENYIKRISLKIFPNFLLLFYKENICIYSFYLSQYVSKTQVYKKNRKQNDQDNRTFHIKKILNIYLFSQQYKWKCLWVKQYLYWMYKDGICAHLWTHVKACEMRMKSKNITYNSHHNNKNEQP